MRKDTEKSRAGLVICILLLGLAASSCVLPAPRPVGDSRPREVLFIAPTLAPSPLPTSLPTSTQPTQPANCVDQLTFVSDVTIPDGTVVSPSASIDKRWEVKNTGTCNWTGKYTLRLVGGDALGARPEQALVPTRGGATGAIRLLLTAPAEPGAYRSAWQAYSPAGAPFGDTIYLDIVVE